MAGVPEIRSKRCLLRKRRTAGPHPMTSSTNLPMKFTETRKFPGVSAAPDALSPPTAHFQNPNHESSLESRPCLSVSSDMARIQCLGFLFDLDGVLVDSTPAVARCWSKWAVLHGFPDPDEIVRVAHGR